jgi:tetratricopeptide (TPR) repeat protein
MQAKSGNLPKLKSPTYRALAELPVKLQQALAFHQQGQLARAQPIYEEILRTQPGNFDALHLLGVIAAQTNHLQRAVELIGKAVAIDPENAAAYAAYSNMGSAHRVLKQWDGALTSYNHAIALKSDFAEAYANRGIVLQELQQLDAALASYNQAIAIKADYSEAYCNRGLALQALGQLDAALASCNQAIAIKADFAEAYGNRGLVLHALGQWDAALVSYNQAIGIKADYVEAYSNRGLALQTLGQLDAALASFNQAIALRADFAEAYCNRGLVLHELARPDAALASYNQAIAIKANYAEAYSNRGSILHALGQLDAALASCDQAIAIKANYAEAYSNRGNVLHALGQWDAALASYDQAIAINADYAEAYSNRGNVLHALGQWDAALASCNQAIALKADCVRAYCNRGLVLYELGQWDAALASYNQAIAIKGDFAEAYVNRSLALLLSGDFDNGWIDHEWRWKNKNGTNIREIRNFSQPLWLGEESIAGKTILLYGEQGFGDTLQFCRYAKSVADLGARVVLEVQGPLLNLLAGLEGVSHLLARGSALPHFDYQCPLLSLPLAFKTRLHTIPAPTPYLHSDAAKAAQWQSRLGEKTRARIGLVWSGNTIHKNDHNRSLLLADLIDHLPADFQYVSLQKDLRQADAQTLNSNPQILNFAGELNDFSDTAALCECMDVLISVDTSVAHLGGALGKKTYVLLPFIPDWRWLLDRDDSPWYPTATLYRQEHAGDWHGVLERIKADLGQTFNSL